MGMTNLIAPFAEQSRPFDVVTVEKSNSSFGNWMVKTSHITFRFFFKKDTAERFAASFNAMDIVHRSVNL